MAELTAERRDLLAGIRSMLQVEVGDFVDTFYAELRQQRGPGGVLDRLTPEEVERLKLRQAGHLLDLLEPDLDTEAGYVRGRQIGRVHAMVGVEIEWYAGAIASHHQKIFELVATLPDVRDQSWLYATIAERLMHDLQAALAGYRDVDAAQHRAIMRVNQAISGAGTVPDLVQGVLNACTAVDGLAAGFFGRPDEHDVFQFEMGFGVGAEEFMAEIDRRPPLTITVLRDEASGQGPSGRSWWSGDIERSDSYLTDPTTEPWHELGARLGWRSSVSVPINDPSGATRALLSLYSYWPGFFAAPARRGMLLQVKHMFERALAALETRVTVASGVRAYADRSSYLAKLRAGEVEMVYQPIVDLRSGELVKLEALARLRGDHRLILPAEFLPAYGDEELLRLFDLGLHRSFEAVKRWNAEGLDVGVALNIPSISSRDERYVTLVERALARHRVKPSRLTLELLETGYVDGQPRWRGQVLDQFKALGVRLAQDDLGSGYSSLLRLRHFAFDDVKLDQSLIRGQEFDPRGALNFIQPLATLSHSMGLTVIVEGLENRGLIEAALALGADAGQGYGISRPLAADDVSAWAKTHRLDLDPDNPSTHLGALAGHVAWENREAAVATTGQTLPESALTPCPLDRYIARIGDPSGHLAEAHAAVHRSSRLGRGSAEHMRWWRVLTKMLGGLYA